MTALHKQPYGSPRVLQAVDTALEQDLLGASVTDSFQIIIAGHEKDGFYDYEYTGDGLDEIWLD